MKLQIPMWLVGGLVVLLNAWCAVGQGSFQNLDFESAAIVHAPGRPANDFLFAQAFPGWTGYIGGVQEGLTSYNDLVLDTAVFSIIDRGFINPLGAGGLIQGNFTAVLMSGLVQIGQPADATLAQTGLVPTGTESLQFRAHLDNLSSSDTFSVALGGQTLSLIALQAGANYILYGADIHAWAGQTAELAITCIAQRPHQADTYLYLDSIQFSDQPVPEPGVLGLSALGALLLGWRVQGRRQ
jgi:hypothetical protein